MKNKTSVIIITVLLVLIIAGATVLYTALSGNFSLDDLTSKPSQENADGSEIDYTAPDFVVYDRDGKQYKLSDLKGKPVVLNFWASWCVPCKSEMPVFEAKYREYGDDVVFMMVNLTDGSSETVDSASSFIDSQGYTFPVYYDTDLDAAIKYGVSAVPITYFIDVNGELAYGKMGALTDDILQFGIDLIYSE